MARDPSYFSHNRTEMLPFLPKAAGNILDVGCGSGAFGLSLKEIYPNSKLFGIEIDSSAAKEAAKIYNHVWEGDVCEVLRQCDSNFFDLIVFNDILEHIADPWYCLKLAKSMLLPHGTVVASIPNLRCWPILSDLFFHGNWKYRDVGVMDITHLRFFTENSIRSLFRQSGYNISMICGINELTTRTLRWRIINLMFCGRFQDCLFPQFAVVAIPDSQLL